MRDRAGAGISWAAAAATSLALLVAAAPAFGSTAVSADFSYSPALPAPGQPVTFTSTSQGARLQGWDLDGDGRFYDSFDTTATRTFAASGSYIVRLGVLGDHGDLAFATHTVVVDQPPVAKFDSSPDAAIAGRSIALTSTSTDADGSVASATWDLNGDGSYDDATGASANVTFPRGGAYAVGLRVMDDKGAVDTIIRTIDVAAAPAPPVAKPDVPAANVPPVVGFTPTGGASYVGDIVSFRSTSFDPDGTIARQEWDLDGDGRFGDHSGPAAETVFAQPGAHVVGLRVTDSAGASAVAFATIEVSDVPVLRVGPAASLQWLTPFPIVYLRGTVTRAGARIARLSVLAPVGARIELGCAGRGCPARTLVKPVRGAGSTATIRLRAFERRLRPGTVIQIRVNGSGKVGKWTRFRIRSARVPLRSDGCILPGSRSLARCPRP